MVDVERRVIVRINRYGHGEQTYVLVRTDIHCIACGHSPTWTEDGDGDYYVGASVYCLACGAEFTWQGGDEEKNKEFMAALRTAVGDE